jgi:hypothetical protein
VLRYGNTSQSWEEEVRPASHMCSYHAHQVDKDEKEAQRPATRKKRDEA